MITCRPAIAALLFPLLLAACTAGGPRPQPAGRANPSAVVAAEVAFNAMAQQKGQWTSFRATAAPNGEMFVPQRVNALSWLKGKADPVPSVTWQPHMVWSSCDGSVGVTHGAWQRPSSVGYFTTVWNRQPGGEYKWALDHGDRLDVALPAPEMIAAKVAECSIPAPAPSLTVPGEGMDYKVGLALDRTLIWESMVFPNGSRTITVKLWTGKGYDTVLQEQVAAGG